MHGCYARRVDAPVGPSALGDRSAGHSLAPRDRGCRYRDRPAPSPFGRSTNTSRCRVHVVHETLGVSGTSPAARVRAIASAGAGHAMFDAVGLLRRASGRAPRRAPGAQGHAQDRRPRSRLGSSSQDYSCSGRRNDRTALARGARRFEEGVMSDAVQHFDPDVRNVPDRRTHAPHGHGVPVAVDPRTGHVIAGGSSTRSSITNVFWSGRCSLWSRQPRAGAYAPFRRARPPGESFLQGRPARQAPRRSSDQACQLNASSHQITQARHLVVRAQPGPPERRSRRRSSDGDREEHAGGTMRSQCAGWARTVIRPATKPPIEWP